ncbi:phosphotransferase [Varibaculum cambriense]|uniref:phosphotransferase enzyme family protein n=1 Tax=Varibaculum cambriense TaxID=184870 RepID=UPI000C7E033C|nr:phosphotransferase [Varibaculum cambriense]WIK89315.1 phosphotransferase [Varibaculum cambriense]
MDREQQLEVVNNSWPPFSASQAAKVLREIPDFRDQQIASLSPSSRPMAAACLVTTASGKQVFLKRYHKDLVSASELEAKHYFVNQLADGGFSTPRFFCFNQGGSTLTTGEWIIEASAGALGQDRYHDLRSWLPPKTREEAVELGRVAARLRIASQKIQPQSLDPGPYQNRIELLLGDPLPKLAGFLDAHPVLANYLQDNGHDLGTALEPLRPFARSLTPLAQVPRYFTHGDLHVSNTFWEGNSISSLIDFGLACPNPPLFDLAVLLERHSIDWISITAGETDSYWPQVAGDLLTGYGQIFPLPAEEIEMLGAMIALCNAEFSLSAIEYDLLAPIEPQIKDWAWDIGFQGHSQWFLTEPGKKYLSLINQLAKEKACEK